jgi:hypothetical protein
VGHGIGNPEDFVPGYSCIIKLNGIHVTRSNYLGAEGGMSVARLSKKLWLKFPPKGGVYRIP